MPEVGFGQGVFSPASRPFTYYPDGWNTGWVAAKAAAYSSSPAWVMAMGDSILAAGPSSPVMTKSAWALIRQQLLNTGLPLYADCYHPLYDVSLFAGAPFTQTGTSRAVQALAGFGRLYNYSTAADGTCQFVTPYPTSAIDILYFSFTAGTWQYTVDGGSAVVITNTAADYVRVAQIRGLSNAAHTIVCSGQNVGSVMRIAGVTTYNTGGASLPPNGIGFFWNNAAGAGASDWSTDIQTRIYMGMVNAGSAVNALGAPLPASLVIISIGVNDCADLTRGAPAYGLALKRTINSLRRANPNVSIIFHVVYNPDAFSSDLTSGAFTNAEYWMWYVREIYQLAQMYGCAVVNTHARWAENSVSKGFTAATDPHPIVAGSADIAAQFQGVI